MYENLAWKHFLLTGDIESFMEYKKLLELNVITIKNEGDNINETYQSKRDCHSGSCV